MINLFLKARHWQLFIAMVGIPLVLQFYYMYRFFGVFESISAPNMRDDGFTEVINEQFVQFDHFSSIMIVFSLLLFGWFWSIAIGLQKKIPTNVKMKVKKFKLLYFIPVIYILFISLFIGGVFSSINETNFINIGVIFVIILPLHLFSMFCIFHSIYFVAKTIKTAELQREVVFGDFIGEFFLLWFYFVGIWIVQPKVNRLNQKQNTEVKQ